MENDLEGKRKVLNLIVAGAEYVREDIEQMSRMIVESHRLLTSANIDEPSMQQLAHPLQGQDGSQRDAGSHSNKVDKLN